MVLLAIFHVTSENCLTWKSFWFKIAAITRVLPKWLWQRKVTRMDMHENATLAQLGFSFELGYFGILTSIRSRTSRECQNGPIRQCISIHVNYLCHSSFEPFWSLSRITKDPQTKTDRSWTVMLKIGCFTSKITSFQKMILDWTVAHIDKHSRKSCFCKTRWRKWL